MERGWAVGNMGGTVTQEETGAENRNPLSWVCAWETKPRVGIKYYPGGSAGREERWGGKASEGDSDVGTVWGGDKSGGGPTRRERGETRKKNIIMENELIGKLGNTVILVK